MVTVSKTEVSLNNLIQTTVSIHTFSWYHCGNVKINEIFGFMIKLVLTNFDS